ncbi:MAG TPA: nicotinamidase [Steroidobacteraceae bacterium]|nr:nicotinamidase [Steroidobacteraceae bacterium]
MSIGQRAGGERVRKIPREGDALLVVDVQNDFLPGGALAVPRGDEVIAPLNDCLHRFAQRHLPVFVTRDWHPQQHCSFRDQGGPWPPHCVAGTRGAAFAAGLQVPSGAHVISKAIRPEAEAYSAFQGTDLALQLRKAGVRCVVIGGLATDYCVRATALDALAAGFAVVLLAEAVRAVDLHPGDGTRALAEMRARGAQIVTETRAATKQRRAQMASKTGSRHRDGR